MVYRTTVCTIDAPLLEKLSVATRELEESIHERGWSMEIEQYQRFLNQAQSAAGRQQLREAFAAQCRALMVLMVAVAQQRNREESFRPLWDRPAAG